MKIDEKLYVKYGTNAVILPPPAEEEDIIDPSKPLTQEKVSPFLSQFTLEEGEDSLDPEWFENFEPEKLTWRQNKLPKEVSDDFAKVKQDMAEEKARSQFQSDVPVYERELLESLKGPPSSASGPDKSTVPPKKKASIDRLLAVCDSFHKKAVMLPPPFSGDDEKIPRSSPLPEISDPTEEELDFILQMRKLKEKERKRKHETDTIHSSKELTELVRVSSKYYDLCRKL